MFHVLEKIVYSAVGWDVLCMSGRADVLIKAFVSFLSLERHL